MARKEKKSKLPIDPKAPNGPGQRTEPNPGEFPPDGLERGLPTWSLGSFPPQGNRAGGGKLTDPGAVVAYRRNLEFTSGGRSALIKTDTASTIQPTASPETGQTQISSVASDDLSAGKANDVPAQAGATPTRGEPDAQPGMPPGGNGDTAQGPPDRRGL